MYKFNVCADNIIKCPHTYIHIYIGVHTMNDMKNICVLFAG